MPEMPCPSRADRCLSSNWRRAERIGHLEARPQTGDLPPLPRLRVVVLTTSDSPDDIDRAYEMGANAFMVKPLEKRQFLDLTDAIKGYWLWMSAAPDLHTPQAQTFKT